MRQNDSNSDVEAVIASDLPGGDILHSDEKESDVLPSDEVKVIEGGLTDVTGTVPLGGSSDVGGTGDTAASADVGATTGAAGLDTTAAREKRKPMP